MSDAWSGMPPRTDHSEDIMILRVTAAAKAPVRNVSHAKRTERLAFEVAGDLLELHDSTGISLDSWPSARKLVEHLIDHEIEENHV